MSVTEQSTGNGANAPKPAPAAGALSVEPLGISTLLVPVVSTAPLLMHRFSEKAKAQMLAGMQGKRSPKVAKDPQAEYEAAIYYLADGQTLGFPVTAFKSATVSAARFYNANVTMTLLRQALWFIGEAGDDGTPMVRIDGMPRPREDVARVGRGVADLRYRAHIEPWTATLHVEYVRSQLTADSVLALIDAGGRTCGVGEWRPERSGSFGTYTVDRTRQVAMSDQ